MFMLSFSAYTKTMKKYSKNNGQSNIKFVNFFLGNILTNLGIEDESIANYIVEPNRLSPIMNEKETLPAYIIAEICAPQRSEQLLKVFSTLIELTLDDRLITNARQEILKLAGEDERYRAFLKNYMEMDNTTFFTKTFLDVLNVPKAQTPQWRLCSGTETCKDALELSKQIMLNDQELYKGLPSECTGTREQWADMFRRFPECSRFLLDGNSNICGNFSFIALTPKQEKLMLQGNLVDISIKMSECPGLDKPGTYSIYLLNLSINQDVPLPQYTQLWDAFFAKIKEYAQKGIRISRIYYKAFLPEHEAKMLGRGFCFLRNDNIYGKIFVREISEKTPDSLYAEAEFLSSAHKMEAEAAYLTLFREIDELFINPRLCQLKPYFYSGFDISKSHKDYALGLAVAEFIRDAVQYASSLLDFLPEYRKKSHEQFESILQRSCLIQVSKEQYTFATEDPEHIASRLEQAASSPIAIVKFANIWLSIDNLFMQEDLIHLRPFFYDQHDKLPVCEQDLDLGIGLAVRIMSSLVIAEGLLSNIPQAFIISFYEYKKKMWRARIIQEAANKYPFLAKELRL